MAATSATALLNAIDAALLAILGGTAAHVTVNGVNYSALNVDGLRQLRRDIAPLAAREARAGGRPFAVMPLQAGGLLQGQATPTDILGG